MALEQPERQRLFFALTPSSELAQAFHQVGMTELLACRGRHLKPEQIHLTLRFIGSADHDMATCLREAAGCLALPAFELVFDTLGYWPRPKVVWSMLSRKNRVREEYSRLLQTIALCPGFSLFVISVEFVV